MRALTEEEVVAVSGGCGEGNGGDGNPYTGYWDGDRGVWVPWVQQDNGA